MLIGIFNSEFKGETNAPRQIAAMRKVDKVCTQLFVLISLAKGIVA
jgi:hypothetical protein